MRLFFMRHAQAAEREAWDGEENDRPLTADGILATQKAAASLAGIGLRIELVLTSPLARAMTTAAIVGAALKPPRQPVADDRLSPGFDSDALDELLDEHEGTESILLVGHEPDLGLVVGELVSCARIEFKKGALALVEIDEKDGQARLLWLIPQKVLAVLADSR
jgi:phosphohistidine phosphatase